MPKTNMWYSPISYTAEKGDLEMLQFLLSKGASTEEQGFDLLSDSLRNSHFKFAEFLLGLKVSSVNDVDSDDPSLGGISQSILARATKDNLLHMVEFLIEHGADVHHPSVRLDNDTKHEIIKLIQNKKELI